jgi:hypothetical protein
MITFTRVLIEHYITDYDRTASTTRLRVCVIRVRIKSTKILCTLYRFTGTVQHIMPFYL